MREYDLIIAVTVIQAEVLRQILHHLQRAADPLPLAPARFRQAMFAWVAEVASGRAAPASYRSTLGTAVRVC
jgi:hypothetical protein